MRYKLSDYEWGVIKPMLRTSHAAFLVPTTDAFSTASSGSYNQVYRGAICRRATVPYDLLQSLRSLAAGWRLGSDHGCPHRCS